MSLISMKISVQQKTSSHLISSMQFYKQTALFCSLAVLHLRVSHIMDVLSPFISVLCHSD